MSSDRIITWDGDPNKPIDLRDEAGLALYRKSVEFERYVKAQRLKIHWCERSTLPLAAHHLRTQQKDINALEAEYPDFAQAYNERYARG